MKILFIGLGSIGKRHAKILQNKYEHKLFALRSSKDNQKNDLEIEELYSWNEVKKIKPDIAFITNPTALHIQTAIICARLNCKLFIDKPIDSKLKKLDKLVKIIKDKKLVTYIGYNMRFHPVILELKKHLLRNTFLHMSVLATSYLPNWRKGTDHKKSYRSSKKMGGGIILDLSHEFDYINYLLGDIKILNGQFSRRSDLTLDAEDWVDTLISTPKGPVNLHLNFFSHKKQRIIQIDFKRMTVIGDLANSTIEIYKEEKLISKKSFPAERNISFENQLDYFFKNIDNPEMMNNIIDAAPLYEKIIAFKKNE